MGICHRFDLLKEMIAKNVPTWIRLGDGTTSCKFISFQSEWRIRILLGPTGWQKRTRRGQFCTKLSLIDNREKYTSKGLVGLYPCLRIRLCLQPREERELPSVGVSGRKAILDKIALLSNLRQGWPTWYRAGLQPKAWIYWRKLQCLRVFKSLDFPC